MSRPAVSSSLPSTVSGGRITRRACRSFASSELVIGGVGADDGGKLIASERQAEAHQTIIDGLWQTGQTSHDIVLDDKGDTSVALHLGGLSRRCNRRLTPQLPLLRESGLAESSSAHLVSRHFLSDKRRSPFRSVAPQID
ncbi:unnamed protein product [Schistocephalus solidus]|uniref:Uncharacterized protein n=1 Tax=Schistocephalus solidus TaxID=70667 RepID=A0A183STQ8_SCHSO|nr:unnamed protein product [Schistocephalus solidus]